MKAFENMKGALMSTDMKQPGYQLLYWSMFAFLIFVSVGVCLFPVVWILLSGFKGPQELYSVPATLFPENFNIMKLAEVWCKMKIYAYYLNTTYMALGHTFFVLVISGLAGYVLSKIKPVGTRLINNIVFWLMLIPGTMSTVPLYMTFKEFPVFGFSMLDTYWPMWLLGAASPFNIILFKSYFNGIPNEIIEASRIDGLSDVGVFGKIMMPMGQPIFLVVGLFAFMGSFGTFLWPYLIITDADKTVLAVQLYKLRSTTYTQDYQMLAVLYSVLPLILLYAIFQDRIVSGINLGGVKG